VRWRPAGSPFLTLIEVGALRTGRAATEVIAVAAGALLLIGLICGYDVRALISRWHRAKATRRRFERVAEEDADEEA
jgi:hypothetical protein